MRHLQSKLLSPQYAKILSHSSYKLTKPTQLLNPQFSSPIKLDPLINKYHILKEGRKEGKKKQKTEHRTIMEAEMLIRCVFDGSISMQDFMIQRRPYHRNCGCALHDGIKNRACPNASSVSFLQKFTKTSLQIHAHSFVIHTSSSTTTCSQTIY